MRYLLILILIGCYTPKQASREARKAMRVYPAVVAELCAENFPIRIVKTDTLIYENIVEIECPDSTIITNIINSNDTIRIVETRKEKVYVEVPGVRVVIKEQILDSASLKSCELKADAVKTEKDKEIQKQKGKVKFWQGGSIFLFIIATILGWILGRRK